MLRRLLNGIHFPLLISVVALAAVTQNSLFFLLLGLALSVPLLMYGSLFVTGMLKRYPILIPAGCALLGWVAGDIGTSDPLLADWVSTQAPALTLARPLACASRITWPNVSVRLGKRKMSALA